MIYAATTASPTTIFLKKALEGGNYIDLDAVANEAAAEVTPDEAERLIRQVVRKEPNES